MVAVVVGGHCCPGKGVGLQDSQELRVLHKSPAVEDNPAAVVHLGSQDRAVVGQSTPEWAGSLQEMAGMQDKPDPEPVVAEAGTAGEAVALVWTVAELGETAGVGAAAVGTEHLGLGRYLG